MVEDESSLIYKSDRSKQAEEKVQHIEPDDIALVA
jgi:hypothetical protein